MRQLLWLLAILCCSASAALAGPNAGGVLVVHDTQLLLRGDSDPIPPVNPPPADCASVDNQFMMAEPGYWKIYAVFPSASSPRLKGVSWGEGIHPQSGAIVVQAAGLPDPANDFEITQHGFPTTDGGSVGMSFPSGAKLTTVTELYWFGGYAYAYGEFCAQPHSVQPSIFVDDSFPALTDPIAAYGCLGFGQPGYTPCPAELGACCEFLGSCTLVFEADCTSPTATWHGEWVTCDPNPCPFPDGACCSPYACAITTEAACQGPGWQWFLGGACTPNPCPVPVEAPCCIAGWVNGQLGWCVVTTAPECVAPNVWHPGWTSCDPSPCPTVPVEDKTWGRIKSSYR